MARDHTSKLGRVSSWALASALCATTSLGGAQYGQPLGVPSSDVMGRGPNPAAGVDEKLLEARSVLDRGRARRAEIDGLLAGIGPRKAELRQRLLRDARSLYRVSRGGLLPLAGGIDALLGHASRVGRLERLVESEAREYASLDKQKLSLRKEASEWDLRMAQAERDAATLEQARVGLAQQQATQAMFDSAFKVAPAAAANEPIQYGLSVVGGMPHERFGDQRGNLALPVSGPASIQEARRAESDGPGLEFSSSHGAAVRAAAAGRVAFAERYGSYGQIVILDHGERYYTVYGGLSHIEVQVGDDVSKSARLGAAGAEPVYFEVRRGTKTQEPRSWLGL
jgi:murein DD-endopeptidase MepM/ murein hydrolase activator NlpD